MQKTPIEAGVLKRDGSTVTIECTISCSDQISVALFNPAGKQLASLVKRHLTTGKNKFLWDAGTFSQGCYILKVKAGTYTYTKLVQFIR